MATYTLQVRLSDKQIRAIDHLAKTLAEEVFLFGDDGGANRMVTLRLALDRGIRALKEEFGLKQPTSPAPSPLPDSALQDAALMGAPTSPTLPGGQASPQHAAS